METFDTVIVGAGPAGALLAELLANRGIRPLVLEKRRLPRYKACGGGLTPRALALLPFDPAEVIEDRSYTFHLGVDGRAVARRRLPSPFLALVSRDRFDHRLVRRAESAGAVVRDGTPFRSVSGRPGDLRVETPKGRVTTRLLIGADGAGGRVRRTLGLRVGTRRMWALEAELHGRRRNIAAPFHGEAHFDFLPALGGYGWLFPKAEHLSMGVLTASGDPRRLRPALHGYIASKKIGGHPEIRTLKGHAIPHGPDITSRFAGPAGLVVGDAAGITDPLTGEGLYFAFKGARLAADAVAGALAGDEGALPAYGREMRWGLRRETCLAGWMARTVYGSPGACRALLNRFGVESAGNLLRIIRGEKTYGWLMAHLLHPSRSARIFRALRRG